MSKKDDKDFLVPHVVGKFGTVPTECPRKDSKTCKVAYVYDTPSTHTRLIEEQIEWKENKPFKTALKFSHLYAIHISKCVGVFYNVETRCKYHMREEDFVKLINTVPAITGVFVSDWIFRRGGRYISISLA